MHLIDFEGNNYRYPYLTNLLSLLNINTGKPVIYQFIRIFYNEICEEKIMMSYARQVLSKVVIGSTLLIVDKKGDLDEFSKFES